MSLGDSADGLLAGEDSATAPGAVEAFPGDDKLAATLGKNRVALFQNVVAPAVDN